jgi:hypothetical protein
MVEISNSQKDYLPKVQKNSLEKVSVIKTKIKTLTKPKEEKYLR